HYDVDPRVPLILGRPFLRMAYALVDHGNKSINMINFIDITCEDRFPEVLKFKSPLNGRTTPLSNFSPSLTPFETSDSLREEFADELALLDPFPPGNKNDNFDFEADPRKIKYLLNQDLSTSSPTNLLSITHLHREMTMMIFLTLSLIMINGKRFCMLLDNDSTLLEEPYESSEIASLYSSPFGNKDKDRFPEVLKFKSPLNGRTTPLSNFSPSLTPFETSDSLREEFADELALLDPFPPGNKNDNFDFEADPRKIKYLLNQDLSTESDVEIIDPILKKFTNEPAIYNSPPPGDDDDDLFDLKSDNDEWKKILYGNCYKDIDSEKDKSKDSKM
nr:hypothetical protein [Tanacetum cinerariifolium]